MQSLQRTLTILSRFLEAGGSLSLSEVANVVDLPKPTVHRLLQALVEEGLLSVSDRRYVVGPATEWIAYSVLNAKNPEAIAAASASKLAALRDLTGETVGLHCRIADRRVCVLELPSPQPIRMSATVGLFRPLHSAAVGKALLAWLTHEQLDELLPDETLEAVTKYTTTSRSQLLQELAQIREAQYATSSQESILGATAIAAPIFGRSGAVEVAVNVAGPTDRWLNAKEPYTDALVDTCQEISRSLGFEGLGAKAVLH